MSLDFNNCGIGVTSQSEEIIEKKKQTCFLFFVDSNKLLFRYLFH